jgi:ribosome-binding protein aMBF1 (putative translation factor)
MTGHHKFSLLKANFSPERLAQVDQKTALLKTQMALSELRQARLLSQADLAAKLNVKQPAVARMEKRSDMYVGHLRQVIEAMGGELLLVARFPEGEVNIDSLNNEQTLPQDLPAEAD